MRKILTILTMLICSVSFGQFDKLKGSWITPNQDLISIQDTSKSGTIISNVLSNKLLDDKYLGLSIYGDTLKFQDIYYRETIHSDPYDLKIISLNDSILIVKPVSTFTKEFFQNRESIKFKRKEFAIDNSIQFDKLIYHSTPCLGNCPEIDLQIDNKKNIYLNGEYFLKNELFTNDSVRSGQFKGILSDSTFLELMYLLKTCNLKTLKFAESHTLDSSEITLIIYFNGKRKYLRSTNPPYIIYDLIDFLSNIDTQIQLTRTEVKFDLEK